MTSDRVPSVQAQCRWRFRESSKHHSIILNNKYVYCWILELRYARVFCCAAVSASCTVIQWPPSTSFFQYCDYLHQHNDTLNETQLSHIFQYDFLFLTSSPSLFFPLLPSHLFQSQVLGPPSLFICMLSIYPPLFSSFSCSCNRYSPISYILCLFLLLPSLRVSSDSSLLHCFKVSYLSFYFSSTFLCGHP